MEVRTLLGGQRLTAALGGLALGAAAAGALALRARGRPARRALTLAAGAQASALAVGVYGRFVEPAWIETARTRVPWHGPRLRVVLLTDFHVRPSDSRRMRRIVRRANRLRGDVVLLGGDYVDGQDADGGKLEALAPLAQLRSRLGTFAVLGNHDSEPAHDDMAHGDEGRGAGADARAAGTAEQEPAIVAALRRANVRVLENQRLLVDDGVQLIGLASFRAGKTDARTAFAGADPALPTLLLAHNWRSLEEPGVGRFDLALAGHTHGGQGCIPLVEVCPFLEEDMPPYRAGLYEWPGGGRLYVSRGLGTSGIEARLAARPEITVIDLVPQKAVQRAPATA
jgi:uncharacterized protein